MTFGVGLALLALVSGCKAAPLKRPVPLGPIDTGPGTMEATRRTLEGTWILASLEVVESGGTRRRVNATGKLTYDAFGNMSVRGVIQGANAKNAVVIDYDGRIVIDPDRREFYPADLVSERPAERGRIAPIAPDTVRRYELTANDFVVSYFDAAGQPTAVVRWRR
jgi:hypothetical protein